MGTKNSATPNAKRQQRLSHQRGLQFVREPLCGVLADLDVVARRLRNVDSLVARLVAEGPKISPEEYVSRLRNRKAELIRTVAKLQNKWPQISGKPGSFGSVQVRTTVERSSDARATFRDGKIRFPDALYIAAMTRTFQMDQVATECPTLEQVIPPSATGLANVVGWDSIHHGSGNGMSLIETNLFSNGVTFANAFLDDHASVWRDDNPDRFGTGYQLTWTLPAAPCDMWVLCRIDAGQRVEFTNSADDGGFCETSIMMKTSNEQGEILPTTVDGRTIVFSSTSTASLNSPRFEFTDAFPIRQGRTPQVVLGHLIFLSAQDGLASVVCTLHTNEMFTGSGGPNLWFMMLPR